MKKDYIEFELTMVFVITLAVWIGFGIFLYVTDDNPKLESTEMIQTEETLNTSNLFNPLDVFNTPNPTMNLINLN